MRHVLICLFLTCNALIINAQFNLTRLAHIPNDSATSLAGCWHHVDSTGNEYALIGTSRGLDIWDVSVPAAPVRRFQVPGITNNWREVKTWGGYAYIGSEAQGSGITIVDLRHLPDSIRWKVWTGNDSLTNKIQRSHTVLAQDGWLYVFGSTAPNNGAIICSLQDPWNPDFVGQYQVNYLHDGYVRGDTLWGSEIYAGQFSAIDITDKTQPTVLAVQATPRQFNHNTGLSANSKTIFTTDEKGKAPLASFDVSDLSNIKLLDLYLLSQFPNGEVHNVRVINDFLVCPSYAGQISIVDAADPANLIETAYDVVGTSLVWDADPYLPSGIIIATSKAEGIFIYQPNYQRAARLRGVVYDAATNLPLFQAKVWVENTPNADTTQLSGAYATGAAAPGNYTLRVERSGYTTKTITGVSLITNTTTTLDIFLEPEIIGTQNLPTGIHLLTVTPTLVHHFFEVAWTDQSANHALNTTIQVFDNQGVLKLEQPFSGTTMRIDIAPDWAPGTYFVRGNSAGKPGDATRIIIRR